MGVILVKLASVLGLSLASGVNLYATVAVVGLVQRFELIEGLPAEFRAFDNDYVIGLALLLYACEFLADKIPAFDSVWDVVHTAIRPFGAALIAVTVVGDVHPALEICVGMLGASLGLATHAAKTGTRWVVNTSPEPLSNAAVSVGEDVAVAGVTVLTLTHPLISLALSVVAIALLVLYGPGLARGTLLVLRAVRARFASLFTEASTPRAVPESLRARLAPTGSEPPSLWLPAHARKLPRFGRNRTVWVAVEGSRLVLLFHARLRPHRLAWELDRLGEPLLRRGLLFDRLRLSVGGRPFDLLFVRSGSDDARRLQRFVERARGGWHEPAPSRLDRRAG
jgi:hypothetical protein